jgi:hypothetical protein
VRLSFWREEIFHVMVSLATRPQVPQEFRGLCVNILADLAAVYASVTLKQLSEQCYRASARIVDDLTLIWKTIAHGVRRENISCLLVVDRIVVLNEILHSASAFFWSTIAIIFIQDISQ